MNTKWIPDDLADDNSVANLSLLSFSTLLHTFQSLSFEIRICLLMVSSASIVFFCVPLGTPHDPQKRSSEFFAGLLPNSTF